MGYYMDSTDLLKSIKRRALIPANQSTFSDADLLAFADEEMNMGIVPSVLRSQEDYFLISQEVPLVAGQTRYPVPYRAIGNRLRDVALLDVNGNVNELTRIGIGDLSDHLKSNGHAFYMSNNEVVLVSKNLADSSGSKLLMSYYIRPNSLVEMSAVAPITSIDRTTGIVQVSNLPSNFNQTLLYDLVQIQSPHKTLDFDIQVISINTTSKAITLSTIPTQLQIGDQLCLATQSAIPQIPSDLHVMLAHRVASRVLEAIGDTEGLQAANTKLAELEAQTQTIIDDRVEDAPKKISSRHSTLRAGAGRRRLGRF